MKRAARSRRTAHPPRRYGRHRQSAAGSGELQRFTYGLVATAAIGWVLPVLGVSLLLFLAADQAWARR